MPIILKSKRDRITAALTPDKIYIEANAPVEIGNAQEREEFYEDCRDGDQRIQASISQSCNYCHGRHERTHMWIL